MNPVQPTPPQPPLPDAQRSERPSTRSLLCWGALVLALHLVVLLSLAGTLDWQLSKPQTLRTGPMQTRTIPAPAGATAASDPSQTPEARTRVALVEKPKPKPAPKPAPTPKPDTQKTAADPSTTPEDKTSPPADPPVPEQALAKELNKELDKVATLATPDPVPEQLPVTQADTTTDPNADKALAVTPGTQTPSTAKSEVPEPIQSPIPSVAAIEAAAKSAEPHPERIANATMALPEMALGSLPSPALLSYRLSGQEKGITYQASGELRWQHNDSAYAMSLTVKAFLLGSRHWRSVGQINATGLAPTRFSDSWRSERAAHFDRPNERIVFSSNAPKAPLQAGAQDQVSLYVQLAAAMAQSGQQMTPGTRLQIQTVTVRDALPWLLTLEKLETLQIDGQSLQAVKWVCQPRNRFDAQVEFWVSAAHDWLPARIRITQVSGSFIDLQLTGRQVLSALPVTQ